MGIKYLVLSVGITLLNGLNFFFKLLPIKNKITFITRQSDDISLDFNMLLNELESSYPEIGLVVIAKKLTRSLSGLLCYIFCILEQMYHIATSKVVVIDGYCIPVSILKHKEETVIVQIWHALGAIKKFGFQTIDKPSGHSSKVAGLLKMHENYDYVICASSATAVFYCEAFNITSEKLVKLALPRADYILREDNELKKAIEDKYNTNNGKENILFVPTFRKGKPLPLNDICSNIDFNKINLFVKLHPLDDVTMNNFDNGEDNLIFEKEFSTYDMSKYCDRIVTDYSALGIEASLLDKPVYFFVYDIDEYMDDPGLNVDIIKEMKEYAIIDTKTLATKLLEEYDYRYINDIRKKYIEVPCNDCTKELSKFIAGLVYKEDCNKANEKDNQDAVGKYS